MAAQNGHWQNRIVGYDNVAPDQLLANPANYRLHPKRQQDALTGSLNELGWLQDIIVNRTTQHVLDGHLRVQLALRKGEATVPVKYVELSEAEEKLAIAVFDPITYMAETDAAILDELLQEINTGEASLQELLEGMAIDAGLVPPDNPNAHWQGMPEFEQDSIGDNKITVYFADNDGRVRLSGILGQPINPETKFVWFPEDARPMRQDAEKMKAESES